MAKNDALKLEYRIKQLPARKKIFKFTKGKGTMAKRTSRGNGSLSGIKSGSGMTFTPAEKIPGLPFPFAMAAILYSSGRNVQTEKHCITDLKAFQEKFTFPAAGLSR